MPELRGAYLLLRTIYKDSGDGHSERWRDLVKILRALAAPPEDQQAQPKGAG